MCTCGSPASLRTSNTPRNPGRSFFGCSMYNSQGLPHCNYFKWADSDSGHEREKELVKIEINSLRNEEELQKTKAEFQFQQIAKELRKREEEIRNWMEEVRKRDGEIVKRDLGVGCQCRNIKLYLIICILLYLYFSRSQ
ncbi:hypothetical protein I3843_10G128500 [Carya illinoinensis]|nr:hypothetical protein I3843_10G128500 [Carya illinoinensis]